ncbi:MAG: GGDEF domain-containing protein [Aeromonadaceae bacterium]
MLNFNSTKKIAMIFINFFILCALGGYGYQSLRHDMELIVEREGNVFDIFSRRAELLSPAELLGYMEEYYNLFSNTDNADVFVYGYELTSRERFAIYPISNAATPSLAIYRYVLSYPDVVGLYLLTNEKQLIGMSADRTYIPEKLEKSSNDLFKAKPWLHYFDCEQFKLHHVLCSKDISFVSDISTDMLTHKKIFILYFPFVFFDYQNYTYRYGLTGIDIDISNAFMNALLPFESGNPTNSLVSFHPNTCPKYTICFQHEMMRTKANSPLYLIWQYRIDDFIYRQIKSPAFTMIVVAYLTSIIVWSRISPLIRRHLNKDKLTGLPRRDILDEATLHKYNFLLLIDIDNFKTINDTFGHDIGDVVLTKFAEKIEKQLRVGDLALRWGGEEFLLLLHTPTIEKVTPLILRLLEPLNIDEVERSITFSGGLVQISQLLNIEKATKTADKLLYEVKQNGKNNVATKKSGDTIFFQNHEH